MPELARLSGGSLFPGVPNDTLVYLALGLALGVGLTVRKAIARRSWLRKRHSDSLPLLWSHLGKFRDFRPGDVFISPNCEAGIAVDVPRGKVCLASTGEKPVVVPAASISQVDVIVNNGPEPGKGPPETFSSALRAFVDGKEEVTRPVIESIGLKVVVSGAAAGGSKDGKLAQDVYVIPFFNRDGRDDAPCKDEMAAALRWLKTVTEMRQSSDVTGEPGEAVEVSDVCSRCHRAIARRDEAFVLGGQILCGQCNGKLRTK